MARIYYRDPNTQQFVSLPTIGAPGPEGPQGPVGPEGPPGQAGGGSDEVEVRVDQPTAPSTELWVDTDAASEGVGGFMPPGSIVSFAGSAAPAGWLLCDGAAVLRSAYPLLYAVIGTTYGVGDGSTTFNLPNLKGRAPFGRDPAQPEFDVLGETGGKVSHILTENEMPAHTHPVAGPPGHSWGVIYGSNPNFATFSFSPAGINQNNSFGNLNAVATGGNWAHYILPPYMVLNHIVKV